MSAKINLTLEQDEQRGTNAAMEDTIKLLATLDGLPMTKVVVTLECEEMIAEGYRNKLRLGLKGRPIGIIAKITTKTEEQIVRYVMPMSTPMDDVLDDDTKSALFSGQQKSTGERALDWLVEHEK